MASVRYMVNNVSEAMEFYCERLGFAIERDMHPNFASVRLDDLSLWLAGPGSSAGRPMPDGAKPEAGGWNRLVIHVDDIEALVQRLKDAGASFRNEIVRGPGGAQILIQDPSSSCFSRRHSPSLEPTGRSRRRSGEQERLRPCARDLPRPTRGDGEALRRTY